MNSATLRLLDLVVTAILFISIVVVIGLLIVIPLMIIATGSVA